MFRFPIRKDGGRQIGVTFASVVETLDPGSCCFRLIRVLFTNKDLCCGWISSNIIHTRSRKHLRRLIPRHVDWMTLRFTKQYADVSVDDDDNDYYGTMWWTTSRWCSLTFRIPMRLSVLKGENASGVDFRFWWCLSSLTLFQIQSDSVIKNPVSELEHVAMLLLFFFHGLSTWLCLILHSIHPTHTNTTHES